MAERYVIAPAHVATGAAQVFGDQFAASAAASELVAKDKQPRVVLQVMAEIRPAPRPQVDITQVAEVGRG